MKSLSLVVSVSVGAVIVFSGCFIGRRGRLLTSGVEYVYPCAEEQRFDYVELAPNRYRVYACHDGEKWQHVGLFHCSRLRCESLTAHAARYFSAAASCPLAQVDVRETVDPSVLFASGCAMGAPFRCVMSRHQVSCVPLQGFTAAPPAS